MQRILRKDLVREVKKSFARFISIAILIGMGTTFFIGLNSAAPTMLHTANAYFKEYHYQDLKVIAPVAFNLEDVQQLSEIDLVENGTLGHLAQTLTQPGNLVLEVLSFKDQKEQFKLIEGRYPEISGELVLDSKGRKNYQLGEELSFLEGGNHDPAFKETPYKIVGFVESTRYISKNARGVSAIGNGSVDLFGLIGEGDFTQEPNTIDIELVPKSRQKNVYSSAYEADLVKAKAAVDVFVETKIAETTSDIKSELQDQEKDLAKQQREVAEQEKELAEELQELSDKKVSLEEEKKQALAAYETAQNLLTEHREQLTEVKNRLSISEGAIASEGKRLESVAKQIATQQEELAQLQGQADSQESLSQLEETYQRLVASYEKEAGLHQIELGKLSVIRQQFLSIDQLVQLETVNLPDVDLITAQFANLEKERSDGAKQLADSLAKLKETSTEFDNGLAELTREEAKAELLSYKIQGIDETETFTPFKENIERLGVVSKVVPFVFFFVAFIITTTLILRMIDQSREQIGTLLALGIHRRQIIKKYTLYTLISSVIGLGLGIYLGVFGLSQVIINLYSPMYNFSDYQSQVYPSYIIISLLASVISVVIIPYVVYSRLFKLPALQLIRPKVASSGKRLLIERIPGLWRQVPFFFQRTIRNIMSYKVRMSILLIGFVGCMSLLFISFGARNSVDQLQKKQFYEVFKYDVSVGLADVTSTEEEAEYSTYMTEKKMKHLPVFQEKWESLTADKKRIETFLVSPEESKVFHQYIEMTDADSGKSLTLGESDVVVTEKLAKIFQLKVGDTWPMVNSEGLTITPKVTKIVKNYYLHYVYLGKKAYEQLLGEPAVYQRDFLLVEKWGDKASEELLNLPAVNNVHTRQRDIEKMEEMTAQLNNLIVVLIVAAVLLGLVVLYNLAYITILERKQEIAVMRVMGYRQKQLTRYIFREILLLGFLGILLGSVIGKGLHQLVMEQVELEFLFFPQIEWLKVFNESGFTLLIIASLLMILMHRKIKQINTVEALKVKD
ncbi:FtsX-like permease family protein [Vagococcus sp. BWB3-3]|uniref:FtsX-like permease family protein n=1 Tax=Vagococcus allomyrinae TaxID=2794353 RepID=A0A940STW6_9ENTE|nr:ABC transporter permease [Vagococcus allomyrinae]MBP1039491.1 FtsX-like permease family protein [Vagococcus allomyrinae]